MAANIYRRFRDPIIYDESQSRLQKWYDEPTYLTFKLSFYPKNNDMQSTNYDQMPHPLFNVRKEDDINARNYYSTYQYLRDIKEFQRARMLEDFITDWNSLQTNYQWYFQSVDGLNNLLSFDPTRGIRVSQQDGYITIGMLEGIDQKIFNLISTYRKIAWDDVYQRWILPDLMRFFALDIYVTEFRTFHEPLSPSPEDVDQEDYKQGGAPATFLRVLENTIPTYIIKCEMCEFDLGSLNFENMNSMNVAEMPDQFSSNFRIKVGKIYEEYINPIFNLFWSDAVVNFPTRTVEPEQFQEDSDPLRLDSNKNQVKSNYSLIAQNQALAKKKHYSARPFYENQNHLSNSSPEAGLRRNVNPTEPNSWIDNAGTFGKAFVNNFIEQQVEKAKMSEISVFGQNLGLSYNDIASAFESQSFVTLYGMVRRAIDQLTADAVPISKATTDVDLGDYYDQESTSPSTELNENMADRTFQNFLEGVSRSEATGEDIQELKNAANLILNDQGRWQQIKDYSLATNLTSDSLDEENMKNPIRNTETGLQSTDDRSLATDLDGGPRKIKPGSITEDIPSSAATNNPIKNE